MKKVFKYRFDRFQIFLGVAWCVFFVGIPMSASAIPGSVEVKDNKLTISAENIPLDQLLSMVAEKSDVSILYYGSLKESVSLSISNVSIEEGLRKLLRRCSFSFQYIKTRGTDGSERIILREAIVYGKDLDTDAVRFGPPEGLSAAIGKPFAALTNRSHQSKEGPSERTLQTEQIPSPPGASNWPRGFRQG